MTQRRCLVVRLTKNQHERIRVNAQAKGYKTISQYVRSAMLEYDLVFEKKFDEMYQKLVSTEESIKKNKERPLMEFI
ncbi:MAG: hypothetical protein KAS87_00900 [Candidatus Omnitrophica bacterium]|nr:hypothetical protein [Candidatus Omnitrophota bacterium]